MRVPSVRSCTIDSVCGETVRDGFGGAGFGGSGNEEVEEEEEEEEEESSPRAERVTVSTTGGGVA